MRMPAWTALAVIAVASACTSTPGGLPVSGEPVRVTRTPDAAWPAARGETSLVARSVTAGPDGALEEITGAVCSAESSLYRTEFQTPARVLLPDFGSESPPVVVRCSANGLSGAVEALPRIGSNAAYGGWPSVGVGIGTGGDGGVGVGFSWFGGTSSAGASPVALYPDLRIELR